MKSRSQRSRTVQWAWLFAVVAAATTVVVAAAVWGQMPWEQVPLLVTTLWLGPVLPWVLQWGWSETRLRRNRRNARVEPHDKDQLVADWPIRPPAWKFVVGMSASLGALLMACYGWVNWEGMEGVEDFAYFGNQSHQVYAALYAVWALYLAASAFRRRFFSPDRAGLRMDRDGFTVMIGFEWVRLPWGAVIAMSLVDGYLIVDYDWGFGKSTEKVFNRKVNGHRLRLSSKARPRLVLCPVISAGAVDTTVLDQIEENWGQPVPRPTVPVQSDAIRQERTSEQGREPLPVASSEVE